MGIAMGIMRAIRRVAVLGSQAGGDLIYPQSQCDKKVASHYEKDCQKPRMTSGRAPCTQHMPPVHRPSEPRQGVMLTKRSPIAMACRSSSCVVRGRPLSADLRCVASSVDRLAEGAGKAFTLGALHSTPRSAGFADDAEIFKSGHCCTNLCCCK